MSAWNFLGVQSQAPLSRNIFRNCQSMPEGELTKLKASLVCEKALCGFSRELGLGSSACQGEHSGGRTRPSILADAFEAMIAAIYLDGGMEAARNFILGFTVPLMNAPRPKAFRDL